MKRKIFLFICRILKVQKGEIAPGWLTWIFYPMLKYATEIARIRYDFMRDLYVIGKMKYSGEIFDAWAEGGFPVGTIFQIIERADGVIAIKNVTDLVVEKNKGKAPKIDLDNI